MSEPDYTQAINYAFEQLATNLSPDLTYHSLWHTKEDVVPSCIRLSGLAGISDEEIQLLEVAGAYHDIGFIEQYATHELTSARIVAQVLPGYGFSGRAIDTILGMIMATRLPQSPRNLLEEIIADADLDVLGRGDFMSRNAALRQELLNKGREIGLKPWYEGQVAFLKNHEYFTPTAKMLRGKRKQENLEMLEEILENMDG